LFRLKIALLSVLLSGLVLVGLGLYSLSVMNKVGIARIDREILSLGEGHLRLGPPRGYWQNFENSLKFIYGDERMENLIVMIKDPRNEVLFKSAQWPEEITEETFPNFIRTMDTRSAVPDDRPASEPAAAPPTSAPSDVPDRRAPVLNDGPQEERRGPPPEAYRACEGKSAGNVSQFVNPRGETVKGTCEEEQGRMVLRPDRNRGVRSEAGIKRPSDRLPSPVQPQDRPLPRIKKPYFVTVQTTSGTWRIGIMGSERITMMVGVNMAGYYQDAKRYRRAFLGIIPIALLMLAAGGWVIAQRALRPVALITRTAEGITARALGQRVPTVDADRELSRLVEVINGMLERLEKSFGHAVRFSADAAHELQTPLTILQGELDAAVQHAAVGSDEQRRASSLLEEVQRLKAIVQKLLVLARADAGRLSLHLEAVDLSTMIGSAAEDATALAPQLRIEKEIASGVIVKADSDLMVQVVSNLTSNAVKYNQENGVIRFNLSVRDNRAFFTISNTGAAIPAADRERIFDRFYRVDRSRSKSVSGSGLGLSLAREIVLAHRGDLRLDPVSGNMVSFTLSLPCNSC
jgi:two-component system, OmpR family, heavy metal sensor histidine kinase CusS